MPRKRIAMVAVVLTTITVLVSPPPMALALIFAGSASLTLYMSHSVERQRREHTRELNRIRSEIDRITTEQRNDARDREARTRTAIRKNTAALTAPERAEKTEKAELWRAQDLLWSGFSDAGLARLRALGADAEATSEVRVEAHRTLSDWHRAAGDSGHARDHAHLADLAGPRRARKRSGTPMLLSTRFHTPRPDRHFDVVLMSDFRLPGGTTSSNLQEIVAQRNAGLRTGLIHHPVAAWALSRGVNPKIMAAVDNDLVRFVAPDERVTCDLLIARLPKMGEHPMSVFPTVDAAQRIVVLNQTPNRYYGVEVDDNIAWDVGRCADGFTRLLGEHSWYPISPRVREAMVQHHTPDMCGIPLADEDWTEIIDLHTWRRDGRRTPDGRVLLGRHSRDQRDKWPSDPTTLACLHPELAAWENHVLGGATNARKVLGRLPENWTVHPFDAMDVRDFLHGVDVYVYFTGEGMLEAFGRAPLEAIAVGVPTLLPSSFAPVFGDAALYTTPAGVRAEVESLMSDGERYEQQVKRGHEAVHEHFSHRTHLRRLANLGVRVPAEFLEAPRSLVLP